MSTTTVLDLPPEVLTDLFKHVDGKDLAAVANTCRAFRDATRVQAVWQTHCNNDYGIKDVISSSLTFHDVYTKLLHPYGFLIGLWKIHAKCYGGLLHIKFDGHCITGTQYLTPPDPFVDRPLRSKKLFTISVDEDGVTQCLCHRGSKGSHECEMTEKDGEISYHCCQPDKHRHPEGQRAEFTQWVEGESDGLQEDVYFLNVELLWKKYQTLLTFDSRLFCCPLRLPCERTGVPIQPGLFKGTYSVHGVELILLTYNDSCTEAHCCKVTGDPNVPCGELTVKADLTRPMVLNEQQQSNIDFLQQIDIQDLPPDVEIHNLPKQCFQVPSGVYERFPNNPTTCTSRFHSKGQIAGTHFEDPSFIPGHWVVFNENMFGHLWLELRSLSIYSRVIEDLS